MRLILKGILHVKIYIFQIGKNKCKLEFVKLILLSVFLIHENVHDTLIKK